MNAKRNGSGRTSSRDEAPEITDSWIEEADLRRGQKVVRRGRPRSANPKQLLSLMLPPEVIASWRATGPGWQTRMAEVIESSAPRSRKHG